MTSARTAADRFGAAVAALGIVGALVFAWWWLVASGTVNRIVLPEPQNVYEALLDTVVTSGFWNDVRVTVLEIGVGYLVGAVGGVLFAVVTVSFPFVRAVLTPYVVTFQAVPKVVLLPLLAVWLEIGFATATVVVALVSFFPIYVGTELGLRSAESEGLRLLRSMRASRRDILLRYRVPSALPAAFTGAKTAVNYAILAAITSEFLGSREGLGYRIVSMASSLRLADLYAAVLVTTLIAGAVYVAIELLDRRVVFWRDGASTR